MTTEQTTLSISDPTARALNSSCFDFLLIELVPMAERLSKELSPESTSSEDHHQQHAQGQAHGQAHTETESGLGLAQEDDEIRESTYFRLENLGYRVGQGLAERFAKDRPRFTDNLDIIKFLCKDLWTVLFRKQIDNLKTNHRGVYVLTDSTFKPFAKMSMSARDDAVRMAQSYLWFPCGIIRGALANLGINTSVQAETSELPTATFQIKTVQNRG